MNEKYNDGLLLKYFENQNIFSFSNKLPCFKFATETAEYTDKDRIIDNTVYCVSLGLMLPALGEGGIKVFWRYVESIYYIVDSCSRCEDWSRLELIRVDKNNIYLRIVV